MIVLSGKVVDLNGVVVWLQSGKNDAPISIAFKKGVGDVNVGDKIVVSGELKNEQEQGGIFIYSYLDPIVITSDEDINNIFVVGRFGRDPEVKYFDDGNIVTNFSLATNGIKEDPDWLFCEAYKKTAEIVADYCGKGSQIGFQGYLKSKKGKNNNKIYHTVVGNKVLLLGNNNNYQTQKPSEPSEDSEELPF